MNKAELIDVIAGSTGLPKSKIDDVLGATSQVSLKLLQKVILYNWLDSELLVPVSVQLELEETLELVKQLKLLHHGQLSLLLVKLSKIQ